MKTLLLRHRHVTAVILLAVVLAVVWFFESETGHGWRVDLWDHANDVHDLLSDAPPWAYFTATGILPLLGIPMVSFYLLTASIYSPHVAILGTVYAILINLLLSYMIGRLCHGWISALIARTGRSIPQIPPRHQIWMTAAVRVTPGAPLLVQNYLLVLAGVPLSVFVLVSLPLELLIAAGYVLVGRSLFTGNWKMLLLAAVVVVIAVMVFRTLRKRSERRSEELGIAQPVAAEVAPVSAASTPAEGCPQSAKAVGSAPASAPGTAACAATGVPDFDAQHAGLEKDNGVLDVGSQAAPGQQGTGAAGAEEGAPTTPRKNDRQAGAEPENRSDSAST